MVGIHRMEFPWIRHCGNQGNTITVQVISMLEAAVDPRPLLNPSAPSSTTTVSDEDTDATSTSSTPLPVSGRARRWALVGRLQQRLQRRWDGINASTSFLMRFLPTRTVDEAGLPAAAGIVARLRVTVTLMAAAAVVATCLLLWCLMRAWYFVLRGPAGPTDRSDCHFFDDWLFKFAVMLIFQFLPGCSFFTSALLLGWLYFCGAPLQKEFPQCRAKDSNVFNFITEARVCITLGLAVELIGAISLEISLRLGQRLATLLEMQGQQSLQGPTPQDIVSSFPLLPAAEIPVGTECPVCLDYPAGVGSPRMMWMKLPCDHFFHEACLRPWLATARLCPLCRRRLVGSDAEG
eukprot:TRINITY_DN19300_c0_g1_i13.p1 TRINITY_DN19300_c0_g1~~TRINITY_DN19300_c0_g1_i13.p1  ORF type:complete len:349 (+),score=45.05 TRINITY_DN19300_c0_g1_i13:101-1147(+)